MDNFEDQLRELLENIDRQFKLSEQGIYFAYQGHENGDFILESDTGKVSDLSEETWTSVHKELEKADEIARNIIALNPNFNMPDDLYQESRQKK